MQRFKSPGHAQRFLSAYGPLSPNTSVRAGISFPPQSTVKSYENDFRAGRRSRLSLWPPEGKRGETPSLALVLHQSK
jgi:hypothetical protein